LAKVNVVLKRYKGSTSNNSTLIFENFKLDNEAMKVFKDGIDVKLKTMEFKLLIYLIENKNKVISKKELFENVWGDSFFSDGTLNVHIRKIREKIEDNPNDPKLIKTIWGTGYMFEADEK
jgi:two-component system, OmpR family, response regulator RegX3